MKINLCSWKTYLKRENPVILKCNADMFYWIHLTSRPTLEHDGYKFLTHDYEQLLFRAVKPKEYAVKMLLENYDEDFLKTNKFVYIYGEGRNALADWIEIYYKPNSN